MSLTRAQWLEMFGSCKVIEDVLNNSQPHQVYNRILRQSSAIDIVRAQRALKDIESKIQSVIGQLE